MARAREALDRPRRERGRARRPRRIVVRDVVGMWARQLDRLLHEVPAAIDDARADARGPRPDEILAAQGGEEFLRPLRHDALRDGRGPFLRRERDKIGVHEEPELVRSGTSRSLLDSSFGLSKKPRYVYGPETGTAFGPISRRPSTRTIQWGSRNGSSGCLGTV